LKKKKPVDIFNHLFDGAFPFGQLGGQKRLLQTFPGGLFFFCQQEKKRDFTPQTNLTSNITFEQLYLGLDR